MEEYGFQRSETDYKYFCLFTPFTSEHFLRLSTLTIAEPFFNSLCSHIMISAENSSEQYHNVPTIFCGNFHKL
jgi:hypothetical protein